MMYQEEIEIRIYRLIITIKGILKSSFFVIAIYPLWVYNMSWEVILMSSCCEIKKERTIDEKKDLNNRLNRCIGQLNGIKKMIEEDRYCDDVLIQLSAVNKSIKAIANLVLDNHMHTCLIEHINNGEYEIIDEIVELFKRFQ